MQQYMYVRSIDVWFLTDFYECVTDPLLTSVEWCSNTSVCCLKATLALHTPTDLGCY